MYYEEGKYRKGHGRGNHTDKTRVRGDRASRSRVRRKSARPKAVLVAFLAFTLVLSMFPLASFAGDSTKPVISAPAGSGLEKSGDGADGAAVNSGTSGSGDSGKSGGDGNSGDGAKSGGTDSTGGKSQGTTGATGTDTTDGMTGTDDTDGTAGKSIGADGTTGTDGTKGNAQGIAGKSGTNSTSGKSLRSSGTTVSLALSTLTGDDMSAGSGSGGTGILWDYVANASYQTRVSITPDPAATGRKVVLTAPENMCFEAPTSAIPGLTFTWNANKSVATVTISEGSDAAASFSLITKAVSGNTSSYIGNEIKAAAKAGNPRPSYITEAVVTENGAAAAPVTLTLDPEVYAEDDIFEGLAIAYVATAPTRIQSVSQWGWPYGKQQNSIISPMEYAAMYMQGKNVPHEPFWDFSIKIYIPDGMTVANREILTDAGGDYIIYEQINEGGYMPTGTAAQKASSLDKMTSAAQTNTTVHGGPNGAKTAAALNTWMNGYNTGGRLFGANIDFVLTEEPVANKVYIPEMVIEYSTYSGEKTQTLNNFTFKTDNITQNRDLFSITARNPFEFLAGYEGNTAGTNQYIDITNTGTWTQVNEQHENGSLTLDIGEGVEVFDMTVAKAESVEYFLEDGAGPYTPAKFGDTYDFTEEATEANRVAKIEVGLGEDGLNLMPAGDNTIEFAAGKLPISFNLKCDTGLPDNVPKAGGGFEDGLHRTGIVVTLKDGDTDGCAEYNGQGTTPRITGGEHKITIPVNIRAPQDMLLVQAGSRFNYYGAEKPWSFLSGVANAQASQRVARIGFGYDTFTGTNTATAVNQGYQEKRNLWLTYHDVNMDIESDALETFRSLNIEAGILMKGGKFSYTTGMGESGVVDLNDNGDFANGELDVESVGTAQTVVFPLASGDWLESLTFTAEAFKAKSAHNSYFGYFEGANFVFYAFAEREFRSNGEPIKDIGEGTYSIGATFTAEEVSGDKKTNVKRLANAFDRYIGFSRYNPMGIATYDPNTTNYPQGRATVLTATTVAQGNTVNIPITCDIIAFSSGRTVYNGEVWLKVNTDYFTYADDNPNITVHTVGDETWLILKEDAVIKTSKSYNIKMLCLPTTPLGQHNAFTQIYRNYTDSCDRDYAGNIEPYMYLTVDSNAGAVSDPSDIDGDGRTDEVLVPYIADKWNMKTNVTYAFVSGVSLMPGKSDTYNQGNTQFFHKESTDLNLLATVGGDLTEELTNYETIIRIPQAGDEISYTEGGVDGTRTAGYDLALTGGGSVTAGGMPYTLSYSVDGETYAESSDIGDIGGFEAVKYVRLFFPKLAPDTMANISLPLSCPDFEDLPDGSLSYISADFGYENDSGVRIDGKSNLAAYETKLYNLTGGYVFKDRNSNNVWNSQDAKWAGVEVQLWQVDDNDDPYDADDPDEPDELVGSSPAATTVTGTDGVYRFSGLYMGRYKIKVIAPAAGHVFAAPNVGSVEANKSHVDDGSGSSGVGSGSSAANAGFGTAFMLDSHRTLVQNAGIQAEYGLIVEYRYTDHEGNHTVVYSTGKQDKTAAQTNIAVTAVPSVLTDSGYHMKPGEVTTKRYTTTFEAPEATVVFEVSPNTYKINFDNRFGFGEASAVTTPAGLASKTLTYPAVTVGELPSEPERTGYDFDGWYTEPDGEGSEYTADTSVPTTSSDGGSVTVYAKWVVKKYTVTYTKGNHGDFPDDVHEDVAHFGPTPAFGGQTDSAAGEPKGQAGYHFVGWSPAVAATVTGGVTYVARWVANDVKVNFMNNHDSSDMSRYEPGELANAGKKYDEILAEFANPQRTGYDFSGWYSSPIGGDEYTPGESVIDTEPELTLYAHWTVKTYTLSFDLNGVGGTPPPSQTIKYGGSARSVTEPGADGYEFDGWYTAATGGEAWSTAGFTMPAHDVIIYARWSEVAAETSTPAETTPSGVLGQTSNPPSAKVGFEPSGDGTVLGEGAGPRTGDGLLNGLAITIGDSTIPLFGNGFDSWALVNLMLAIAGFLLAIGVIFLALRRRNDHKDGYIQDGHADEYIDGHVQGGHTDSHADEYTNGHADGYGREYTERIRSRKTFMLGVGIFALAGVLLFLLTQDISLPMVLMDFWTVFNLIIFVAEAVLATRVSRREKAYYEYDSGVTA